MPRILDSLIRSFSKKTNSRGIQLIPEDFQAWVRISQSAYFDEAHYLAQRCRSGCALLDEPSIFDYVHQGRAHGYSVNPFLLSGESLTNQGQLLSVDGENLDGLTANSTSDPWGRWSPAEYAMYLKRFTPAGKEGLPIVMDWQGDALCFEHGRYLIPIVAGCVDSGHPVIFPSDSVIVRQRGKYPAFERVLNEVYGIILERDQLPQDAFTFTDNLSRLGQNQTTVWVRSKPSKGLDVTVWPAPMHNRIYEFGLHRHLIWYRDRERKCRIYFQGASRWFYYIPFMGWRYGLLPRPQLIKQLHDSFNGIIQNDWPEVGQARMVVPNEGKRVVSLLWLEHLSRSDFFIAAPGAYFPFCHNLIESMAVGTIPIVEYGKWMCPALEDGVNCIAFDGAAGLVDAINRALELSSEEILIMRKNVIQYYEDHCRMDYFIRDQLQRSDPHVVHFKYDSTQFRT